eukprot:30251-Pelagococcus_subviridis.AAC.2
MAIAGMLATRAGGVAVPRVGATNKARRPRAPSLFEKRIESVRSLGRRDALLGFFFRRVRRAIRSDPSLLRPRVCLLLPVIRRRPTPSPSPTTPDLLSSRRVVRRASRGALRARGARGGRRALRFDRARRILAPRPRRRRRRRRRVRPLPHAARPEGRGGRLRRPRATQGGPAATDDAHLRRGRDGDDQPRRRRLRQARVQHRIPRRRAQHRQGHLHRRRHRVKRRRDEAHQADQQAREGEKGGERHGQAVRGTRTDARQGCVHAGATGGGDRDGEDLPRVRRGRLELVADDDHDGGPGEEPRVPAGVLEVWDFASRENG